MSMQSEQGDNFPNDFTIICLAADDFPTLSETFH